MFKGYVKSYELVIYHKEKTRGFRLSIDHGDQIKHANSRSIFNITLGMFNLTVLIILAC